MKRRIRLTIEYDGTNYGGWQRQPNAETIQGCIENALFELTGERISITGASRTDVGVHARGQTAHFDTDSPIPDDRFSFALNSRLPRDIRIRESTSASPAFHARFFSKGKRYTYTILNSKRQSALLRDFAWQFYPELDVEGMREAARLLVGRHDFKAFCSTGGSEKTTVRTLYRLDVEKRDELLTLTVEGDAFLYNMVRIIAGTLAYVGCGKLDKSAVQAMLDTGKRELGGVTAPPHGLILEEIYYGSSLPDDIIL